MKTVKIEVMDSNAFDTFEITAEQLTKLEKHKMSIIEIDSIVYKLLASLTLDQLKEFAVEAKEAEMTVERQMRAVMMLAVGDYLGSIA